MKNSRLSRSKQEKLIEHFVAGATARCASSLVGVHRNTAAYHYHRLGELITHHQEQEALSAVEGEIEVDESYFCGARKGNRGLVQEEKLQYLAC